MDAKRIKALLSGVRAGRWTSTTRSPSSETCRSAIWAMRPSIITARCAPASPSHFRRAETAEQIAGIAEELVRTGQNVLVTRIDSEKAAVLQRRIERASYSPRGPPVPRASRRSRLSRRAGGPGGHRDGGHRRSAGRRRGGRDAAHDGHRSRAGLRCRRGGHPPPARQARAARGRGGGHRHRGDGGRAPQRGRRARGATGHRGSHLGRLRRASRGVTPLLAMLSSCASGSPW